MSASSQGSRLPHAKLWLCVSLIIVGIAAVYWPVWKFDFVNFDDPAYVTENPHVQSGITLASLKWAFSSFEASNWHPLTWISHMLDCNLYGSKPGGHHLTNLLLHTLNACLLFSFFRALMAKVEVSFLIAALFAWHPTHVESVAWVAERKDVLSTCFALLALLAYVRYVKNSEIQNSKVEISPKPPPRNHKSEFIIRRFALALFLFALSLLSKPMLVTLPFILLLLDYWPLKRLQTADHGPRTKAVRGGLLVLEKLPFFALSAASCVLTVWAQAKGGAITSFNNLPFGTRAENAALAYVRYVQKLFWPVDLAVFYSYFQPQSLLWPVLAAILVTGFSALLFLLRKRIPYLTVGWFWFLITLLPVIGIVQVGSQAMADRYTYFPSIGIFIMVAFGLSEIVQGRAAYRVLLGTGATGALLVCLLLTARQVSCWQSNETLYRHAIAVTRQNFVACNNLGAALDAKGQKEEAREWYLEAVRIKPDYADAHCNLGKTYIGLKQPKEAIAEFQLALQLNPGSARAHYFLANELLAEHDTAGAEMHYRTALALKADYSEAEYQMATISLIKGDVAAACQRYREALRLNPNWPEALNNLAWILAASPEPRFRDAQEAISLALKGVALTHTNDARLLDTLGGAFAEAGRFAEAIESARTAERLAKAADMKQLVGEIEEHLQSYERREPVRDASLAPAKPDATTDAATRAAGR